MNKEKRLIYQMRGSKAMSLLEQALAVAKSPLDTPAVPKTEEPARMPGVDTTPEVLDANKNAALMFLFGGGEVPQGDWTALGPAELEKLSDNCFLRKLINYLRAPDQTAEFTENMRTMISDLQREFEEIQKSSYDLEELAGFIGRFTKISP